MAPRRARRSGSSHYLVEPGEGLAKGIEIAKRIATNSATTNFAVMHALPRIAEQDRASGYLMESMTAAIAQGNEEAKKRIKDFLEKRAAKVETEVAGLTTARPGESADLSWPSTGCPRSRACAGRRERERMASPQTVRSEARRVRPVRLCAPEVVVDRKPDGTLHLKSSRALPAYPDKLTDRLVHWARAGARPRVHGGARRTDGGWRTITYARDAREGAPHRRRAADAQPLGRAADRRSCPATISSMRCSGLRRTMSAFPMRRSRRPIR